MAVQQQRRRLSVGVATTDVGDGDLTESNGVKDSLGPFMEQAKSSGAKYASICSIKQRDGARKPAFSEKTNCCFSSFPSEDEARKWVEGYGIGFSCRKGMKPDAPNQDNFALLLVEGEFALYMVLDGHGPLGHDISSAVLERLLAALLRKPECNETELREAFLQAQRFVQDRDASPDLDATVSGTTATVAYHDLKKDELTVAHVGDSRAILGVAENATDLTVDHKPNLPEEKKRIENSDPPGRVVWDGYYNHRVFAPGSNLPGLNMSRAIGDVIGHKQAGLSADPDVKVVQLKELRKGVDGVKLLLCTDGVWEFIESAEATKIVSSEPHSQFPMAGIDALVKTGYQRWMEDSNGEISDDITGILIDLSRTPA